jgi:uncharacterized protein YqgV (UPF0045/DUF77 family)
MATCNVSLQVLPFVPEEELFPVVDKAIEVIANSGLPYLVGPLETTMEGELDELMEVVKQAQRACTEAGAKRIVSIVKISYNSEGESMDGKIGKYR